MLKRSLDPDREEWTNRTEKGRRTGQRRGEEQDMEKNIGKARISENFGSCLILAIFGISQLNLIPDEILH